MKIKNEISYIKFVYCTMNTDGINQNTFYLTQQFNIIVWIIY